MSFDIDIAFTTLGNVDQLYSRLVLAVGPAMSGKSDLLRILADRLAAKVVNVNLELSKRMLDRTVRRRSLEMSQFFFDIINSSGTAPVLLDNIEILFEPTLAQDPIKLLKSIARNRTVMAAWTGGVSDGFLSYAEPSHPEYYRKPVDGFLVITAKAPRYHVN